MPISIYCTKDGFTVAVTSSGPDLEPYNNNLVIVAASVVFDAAVVVGTTVIGVR